MNVLSVRHLIENDFLILDVLHKTPAGPVNANVLLFRFAGQVYAYVNHCMHMHRPLNVQADGIFDPERRWLRCSMHGFLFEPTTGICISPVCAGQGLKALKVAEEAGVIVFKQKYFHIRAVYSPDKQLLWEAL